MTVRDVSLLLGISEQEVLDLVERHDLIAYKVGGVYLRFKQEQVDDFRRNFKPSARQQDNPASGRRYSLGDRIKDFFYFNDFYILSILVIILILIIIFQGY